LRESGGPALLASQASDLLEWIKAEKDAQPITGEEEPQIETVAFIPAICTSGTPSVPPAAPNPTCPVNDVDLWTLQEYAGTPANRWATWWGLLAPPPDITIGDVSLAEGNSGTTNARFTLSLSFASSQLVEVDWVAKDGTATLADSDFLAASGRASFPPGTTSVFVDVPVVGDVKLEPSETFTVDLSNPLQGVIADAQGSLDLGRATGSEPVRRPSLAKTRLYLHLTAADLLDEPVGTTAVGEAERLGPATIARIKEWLRNSRATIVPVLDLEREDAVDAHEPPPWMRETVILRDRHCVFPWCNTDARRCDHDHIDPYVPMDEGGPPGQTAPDRLAPLCRRHHRCKTSGRWRYRRRDEDGTYEWHGPHARSYLVTPHGTYRDPNEIDLRWQVSNAAMNASANFTVSSRTNSCRSPPRTRPAIPHTACRNRGWACRLSPARASCLA